MLNNRKISKPYFFFNFNYNLELKLKQYIELKKRQEISGGLIGDIKGASNNKIIIDIKKFLPFPNLAENRRYYVEPPKIWYDILIEWRLFYFNRYKFIGFLHTHPESSSKISDKDKEFAYYLVDKYGTIIFLIISENKSLRSYLFNENGFQLIEGNVTFYKLIKK